MIKTKTVLILGAGASMAYGFPSGRKLKERICTMTDRKNRPFMQCVDDVDLALEFGRKLSRSPFYSVDAFLEHNPRYIDIGKLAIAHALLPRESDDNLFKGRENNWYQLLFNRLISGTDFEHFNKGKKFSVITFNYDRSLEHYLYTALLDGFESSSPDLCAKKLNSMDIVHIYGSLGRLPWQKAKTNNDPPYYEIPFGAYKGTRPDIQKTTQEASAGITILTEGSSNYHAMNQARSLLGFAKRIYVLGFGYDPTNLQRLGLLDPDNSTVKIQGTCHGLDYQTRRDVNNIFAEIKWKGEDTRFNLHDQTVYDFLYKNPKGVLD